MATRAGADHAASSTRFTVIMLAVALLSVELLAGMQRYLSQTVLPLMASELDGAALYGPLDAAAQAPMFLMMPIGAWLLTRYPIGRLMLVFTVVTIAGALVCALAVSMEVFIVGTAIRAVAAGALATIGMGAISRGLPEKYRQLVLAGMSGIWVVSSLIGPVYAVSVASSLGWRWAMVLYLPLLLAARMLIVRYMPERTEEPSTSRAPWTWALTLAAGSAILSLLIGSWAPLAVVGGAALMLWATRSLLPARVFTARRGRRAGLSALMVTTFVYFGSSMVLSVVAYDAFGLGPRQFGFIIAAPGFFWAIAGLWCGSHPALRDREFRARAIPASWVIASGVGALLMTSLLTSSTTASFAGLLTGAALMGLGMGSLYPDLLGRMLTQPEDDDGIGQDEMAGAIVLAETVGMALATTLAFTWLGSGFGLVGEPMLQTQVLYAAFLAFSALCVTRIVLASRSDETSPADR